MLPGEGVEQRQHRVGAPGQHTAREGERERLYDSSLAGVSAAALRSRVNVFVFI